MIPIEFFGGPLDGIKRMYEEEKIEGKTTIIIPTLDPKSLFEFDGEMVDEFYKIERDPDFDVLTGRAIYLPRK